MSTSDESDAFKASAEFERGPTESTGIEAGDEDFLCVVDPTLAESLARIMSAFVDLGFAASAHQSALRPANDDHGWRRIAEDFHRNAA